jgi:hypothetical protein
VRRRIGRASGTLILGALSLVSAGFSGDEPIQVKAGEPFELRIGQKASLAGGDLVLTFLAVPQDSRCPKGEQCIVAGKARVSLEAAPRDGADVALELDTTGESEETDISGFQISLVALSPYPVSGRPIGSQDYLVKLSVRKP